MSNNSLPTEARTVFRQPYVTPQLVSYGLVRELTAGGSGTTAEGAMMTAPKMHP